MKKKEIIKLNNLCGLVISSNFSGELFITGTKAKNNSEFNTITFVLMN